MMDNVLNAVDNRIAHPVIAWTGLFEEPWSRGDISEAQIKEVSGIAASRVHSDILYVLNDSGGKPRQVATVTQLASSTAAR